MTIEFSHYLGEIIDHTEKLRLDDCYFSQSQMYIVARFIFYRKFKPSMRNVHL